MKRIDIGIIGCGNISHAYLKGAARSELVRVTTLIKPFRAPELLATVQKVLSMRESASEQLAPPN